MGRGREGFLYSSLFFNQIIFLQIIKMILQFDKLIITFVNKSVYNIIPDLQRTVVWNTSQLSIRYQLSLFEMITYETFL